MNRIRRIHCKKRLSTASDEVPQSRPRANSLLRVAERRKTLNTHTAKFAGALAGLASALFSVATLAPPNTPENDEISGGMGTYTHTGSIKYSRVHFVRPALRRHSLFQSDHTNIYTSTSLPSTTTTTYYAIPSTVQAELVTTATSVVPLTRILTTTTTTTVNAPDVIIHEVPSFDTTTASMTSSVYTSTFYPMVPNMGLGYSYPVIYTPTTPTSNSLIKYVIKS